MNKTTKDILPDYLKRRVDIIVRLKELGLTLEEIKYIEATQL